MVRRLPLCSPATLRMQDFELTQRARYLSKLTGGSKWKSGGAAPLRSWPSSHYLVSPDWFSCVSCSMISLLSCPANRWQFS